MLIVHFGDDETNPFFKPVRLEAGLRCEPVEPVQESARTFLFRKACQRAEVSGCMRRKEGGRTLGIVGWITTCAESM